MNAAAAGRVRQDGPDGREPRRRVRVRGGRRHRPAVAVRPGRAGRRALAGRRCRDRLLDAGLGGRGTSPCSLGAGISVVIGTTGWQKDEPAIRAALAPRHAAIVAAPNFSTGVLLFEAIVARAAALVGRPARLRRVAPRGASRDEEGRAVRHGADAQEDAWKRPASRVRLTYRRRARGSFRARTRSGSTAPRRRLR